MTNPGSRLFNLAALLLLAGCGGDAGEPGTTDPLPPATASRWAAVERDNDADGVVDEVWRYEYDAADRPAVERRYRAVAGVPTATPVRETLWTYAGDGRMTGIVEREPASGRQTTTTLEYDGDGRLALRRDQPPPPAAESQTRFVWRDGRLVEAVRSGPFSARTVLAYGADGRVASVERTDSQGSSFVTRYDWRPDGQVASSVEESFIRTVYRFSYDAGGRLVSTLVSDDGLDIVAAQLSRDAQGRLIEVAEEDFPVGGFVAADRFTRYRWETARCQPVVMPVVPPYLGLSSAGQFAADNVWFGCGP